MRYMMLIYSKEVDGEIPPEEGARIRAGHYDVMQDAGKKGILQGGEPLSPTATATTVRMQDGKPLITDGPFAETKEQLGGYYLVEAESQEQALGMAGKIPGARAGCVEVRPIMVFS